MSSSSSFGPTFRKIREARGLSLKEVAADIVSPQFLSQFERSQKGVTIETFSRLLLSMGVDWDTFLSHYPGLTIQNFSPILMKHINQENMDFLSIIERLKHEKSPVAEENKELWQLYLRSLEINVNNAMGKEIHLEDAPVSIQRIAQEVPFAYQNEIEQDFTIALLSVLPYEVVAKIRKESLELFESSYSAYSANALASLLLNLANYLIKKELYLEALNFLQSINQLRKRKPILNTSISMQLEFMQVYALLGLNDKEGIYRAKQVMKALEGLIALENFGTPLVQIKTKFMLRVNELNHTGIDFFSE